MRSVAETVDVLVAGGGTAGHIAAIQAARAGVSTSVIEAGPMLGGTMTVGGVYMPNHFFTRTGPVVQGIPWELYTKAKTVEGLPIPDYRQRRPVETPGYYSYINVPVYAAIAEAEAIAAGVILHYHEFVAEVRSDGDWWEVVSLGRGVRRVTRAREIIDSTGDSDVVRALGLRVLRSRVSQPGTLQYKIDGIESEQVWKEEVQAIYDEAMRDGVLRKGDWAYANMEPFTLLPPARRPQRHPHLRRRYLRCGRPDAGQHRGPRADAPDVPVRAGEGPRSRARNAQVHGSPSPSPGRPTTPSASTWSSRTTS